MTDESKPRPETGKLEESHAPRMPTRQPIMALEVPQPMPWRLLLQISGESHTTLGMEVKETILIGRSDANTGFHPDFDLTPYGAESEGVSRRHAQIIQRDEYLFIEDLGSTNRTRLNGYVLEPHQRYRLRDGDELRLGNLRIVVRFVKTPNVAKTT